MGFFGLFKKSASPPHARESGDTATRFRFVQARCPACSALVEIKVYDTLDASEDGAAFSQLLEARLNCSVCSCGRSISAVCPLLVHVPESQGIFFLAPAKMSERDQNSAADQLMHRLRARYVVPPTYLGNLHIVELDDCEYEGLAVYIRKNLNRPLI